MFTISFSYSYVYSTQFNSFSNSNPKQSLDFKKLETQNLKYVQSSKGKNLSNFCCALAFWQICSLNNNMHAFLCSLRSVDSSRDIAVWQASNVKAIPKFARYIQIRAFWWTYFSIHLQTKFKMKNLCAVTHFKWRSKREIMWTIADILQHSCSYFSFFQLRRFQTKKILPKKRRNIRDKEFVIDYLDLHLTTKVVFYSSISHEYWNGLSFCLIIFKKRILIHRI